jgi:predicted CopG family antitoxin
MSEKKVSRYMIMLPTHTARFDDLAFRFMKAVKAAERTSDKFSLVSAQKPDNAPLGVLQVAFETDSEEEVQEIVLDWMRRIESATNVALDCQIGTVDAMKAMGAFALDDEGITEAHGVVPESAVSTDFPPLRTPESDAYIKSVRKNGLN